MSAESWSIDNFVGGPVKKNTRCNNASAIVCVFLLCNGMAYTKLVFSHVAISKYLYLKIPIGTFFKSAAKFSHGMYSVGIRP